MPYMSKLSVRSGASLVAPVLSSACGLAGDSSILCREGGVYVEGNLW